MLSLYLSYLILYLFLFLAHLLLLFIKMSQNMKTLQIWLFMSMLFGITYSSLLPSSYTPPFFPNLPSFKNERSLMDLSIDTSVMNTLAVTSGLDSYIGWNVSTNYCTWTGVTCNVFSQVQGIVISGQISFFSFFLNDIFHHIYIYS